MDIEIIESIFACVFFLIVAIGLFVWLFYCEVKSSKRAEERDKHKIAMYDSIKNYLDKKSTED